MLSEIQEKPSGHPPYRLPSLLLLLRSFLPPLLLLFLSLLLLLFSFLPLLLLLLLSLLLDLFLSFLLRGLGEADLKVEEDSVNDEVDEE